MSEEGGPDGNQQSTADASADAAAGLPPPQQVQLLWPPPMLRGSDGGGGGLNGQQQLVNLVACKTKCNNLDNSPNSGGGDDDVDNINSSSSNSNAFPSGVGLFHQNGRIVFDKSFYPALSDPSKETQDVLCEYVQSSCQEQGFYVRRKQYAKPESNRSKTWRLRLRCKKTSCSFKMNFCWDVEKQYWFIPTGKDGDFVHKCGWTGPPTHSNIMGLCMPCTTTSSSAATTSTILRYPGRDEVASVDPMNRTVKRVMRLPLTRKKKKAKSTTTATASSGSVMLATSAPSTPNSGDEYYQYQYTKPVTPTPGAYGTASGHEFDIMNGNYTPVNNYSNISNANSNRHRLSAAFSRRGVRGPAIRNTSHHYNNNNNNHDASGNSGRHHASVSPVSPIEPPPFPTTNKKPQEPLLILSAAPPSSSAGNKRHHHHHHEHDDRDASDAAGGDEDYLSATLEDMDISDNEEGSQAEILAQISPRLFSNDEEQQHLAAADDAQHQHQLGNYEQHQGAARSGSYHGGPGGYMSEQQQQQGRRQEDGYPSNLFYQLHQQAVDYCSQPYNTPSSSASASSHARYFSWNFLDYCCAPPGCAAPVGGGSDFYHDGTGSQYISNMPPYRHPEGQQQPQYHYQEQDAPTATERGGY
jgi:hypothetical protein